jgi:hypothetical protein
MSGARSERAGLVRASVITWRQPPLHVTAHLGDFPCNPGQLFQFFLLKRRVLLVPRSFRSFAKLPFHICAVTT